jgi:two-component system sensor histidine kinase SenX3
MVTFPSGRLIRAVLYGGGSALLLLDIFFLVRSIIGGSFIPLLPIIAGIFTTAGLLAIFYAEQRAREEDRRDHTRIARVAHQLTTPLKSLQDHIEGLQTNAAALPADVRLQIKQMGTRAAVVLENVRDLFLTLQAQQGKIAQDVRVYDLCAIVKEACERAQPLASAHNVEVTFSPKCLKAPVRIDRRLMLIALAHVLENAIFYTLTPGFVTVTVLRGKKHARVVVQDRGIGINADDATIVTRPFARGERAEQYDADGIGLGLALTQLIMREFDGRLTWQSDASRAGSEFSLSLPLHVPK